MGIVAISRQVFDRYKDINCWFPRNPRSHSCVGRGDH